MAGAPVSGSTRILGPRRPTLPPRAIDLQLEAGIPLDDLIVALRYTGLAVEIRDDKTVICRAPAPVAA